VLGISADSVSKQIKFAKKHDLPFPLLSDEDHAVAQAYGVWQLKKFMGREYMGIDRTTFLIDKQGILRGVFSKFDIAAHPQQVLDAVREL
jgi:peroxiredoxin Q/BCP